MRVRDKRVPSLSGAGSGDVIYTSKFNDAASARRYAPVGGGSAAAAERTGSKYGWAIASTGERRSWWS